MALKKFNRGLPESAYDEAVRQVVDYSQSQSMLSSNFDRYKLFKDGVPVTFQGEHGEIKKERLKVFDFNMNKGISLSTFGLTSLQDWTCSD